MKSQLEKLPPLEKAAILVSALDRASADQLLEQMPESMAAQVRSVLMQLDDIDPDLQQAVLEDFINAQKPKASATQSKQTSSRTHADEIDDVELDLTVNEHDEIALTENFERRDRSGKSSAMSEDESAALFSFLNEAETSVLIREMEKEHPQTVAVVLAQVPPRRAAEILEKLPASLQIEAVRRMVDLDDMDSVILTELAQGFAKQLEKHIGERRRRINGMSRVANILASSPKETEARIMQNLEQYRGASTTGISQVRQQQQNSHRGSNTDERIDSPATVRFEHSSQREASQDAPRFAELSALSDDSLLHVLQHVASEVVVLALAGAEASLIQRITRRLPKSQGEMLNRALSHLGPLRLDEIDVAQQELVRKAMELRLLKTQTPANRRLAAA